MVCHRQPPDAPRFRDLLICGVSELAGARQVEVLAVVFIEQILNTHAGLKMVVKCVARAPRKHAKPRARAEILAGDVTFVLRHAMLRRNHTPQ